MRKMARRRPKQAAPFSADVLRQIERRGLARSGLGDVFHGLMTMRLPALLALLASSIVVINLFFGVVYALSGGIGGARPDNFGDDVFFSVQTFSTTGYGALYPRSILANSIASVEIIIGLLSTALATGLLFARLSRPQARVLFSRIMVVHRLRGENALMFRVANQRRNQLTDARMTLTLIRDEVDEDANAMRRLIDIPLERAHSPAFALSWTVIHRLGPESPLYGLDTQAMLAQNMVFLAMLTGLDDTLLTNVTARHVYGPADIRFGERFADIFDRADDGTFAIDYTLFHEIDG
jgi:inward rectifier potassium channel